MVTENLSTLKIHKLTQEQYDRELEAGRVDSSALYLTPDDGNADTVDGKHADEFADASHTHTITASASDDDVVVLTGTNGTNEVTYSASHANSGVTAGTYKSVTVNTKGHVTGGSNPTTLAGYGITDAAPKYTYGTTDLIAGSSSLTTGKLYFVYE